MRLVLPNKKYEASYFDLLKEAKEMGDFKELGNSLIGNAESYNELIKRLNDRRYGKNIKSRDVAATVYFIIENNEVVGTIDLRHYLSKDYFERLGHVALKLAKKKYFNRYAKRILITCYSDNIASSRVIEKNGGTLEKKVFDKLSGKYILRYIIDIRNDDVIAPKTAWLTTNRTCN